MLRAFICWVSAGSVSPGLALTGDVGYWLSLERGLGSLSDCPRAAQDRRVRTKWQRCARIQQA
jgi:hypothetical protein